MKKTLTLNIRIVDFNLLFCDLTLLRCQKSHLKFLNETLSKKTNKNTILLSILTKLETFVDKNKGYIFR